MNIFEIFEKAKTAKQSGKKYRYADTPVEFEFRSLSSTEGRTIQKLAKAAESSGNADGILAEIIKMNPLVGWENLTKGLLENISALKLGVPEAEMDDPVPFDENLTMQMLATCAGFDGKEIKNIAFITFMSDSIKKSGELRADEISAQKKM